MSNIDKQTLRDNAESTIGILENIAGFEPSDIDGDAVELRFETEGGFDTGCDVSIVDQCQKAADVVRALLDGLEAKDNRINRLEAIVAVAEQRNALMREWKRVLRVPCDLIDDQVSVVIHGMVIRLERLKEAEAKLEAAEKRIAELEAREVKLPELKMLSDYLREVTMREREDILLGVKLEFHRELQAAGIRINGED